MLFLWLLVVISAHASDDFVPIIAYPRGALAALDPRKSADFPRILDAESAALVGKPYELGPLGEGDSLPLYRLDAFDCTTFIETVMANARCFRLKPGCLEKQMRAIRYHSASISFRNRNHVPEIDWLPENVRNGFLNDLSTTLFPGEWLTAVPTIDREIWLSSRTKEKPPRASGKQPAGSPKLSFLPVSYFFRPADLKPEEKMALDDKLASVKKEITEKRAAAELTPEQAHELDKRQFRADLEYLRHVFVADENRLKQIPSGTVLNLVRAREKDPAKAKLTTLIAHQGLILQKDGEARIRHAAPNVGHVSDQPLADYLLRYVRSAHYRGVSLYEILPPR
ncbi:MAG: N-acetylmuramoyl-L-alanine amidase-like domain-containing protein [Bdellovibrionota bacterium]